MLVRGDRAMKRGGHWSSSARLSARQPVSAEVNRRRSRIFPIDDEHGLPLFPFVGGSAARHIGDTGIALPPELVRVANTRECRQLHGGADISHVPRFISGVEVAQQIDVARYTLRQILTRAHAHHLRVASGTRNMGL